MARKQSSAPASIDKVLARTEPLAAAPPPDALHGLRTFLSGFKFGAPVQVDDLVALCARVRAYLDAAGMRDAKIDVEHDDGSPRHGRDAGRPQAVWARVYADDDPVPIVDWRLDVVQV